MRTFHHILILQKLGGNESNSQISKNNSPAESVDDIIEISLTPPVSNVFAKSDAELPIQADESPIPTTPNDNFSPKSPDLTPNNDQVSLSIRNKNLASSKISDWDMFAEQDHNLENNDVR